MGLIIILVVLTIVSLALITLLLAFLIADLALTIAWMGFLIALGRFLDQGWFEDPIKDKIRTAMIAMYVYIYDAPNRVARAVIEWSDRVYESRPYDIRTGEYIKQESFFYGWKYWVIFVPAFAFVFTEVTFVYEKHTSLFFLYQLLFGEYEQFLLWDYVYAFVFFIYFCIVFPLLAGASMIVLLIFSSLPLFFILILLEMIRKFILISLAKSSHPKRSPFSYFTGLFAVISALLILLKELLS